MKKIALLLLIISTVFGQYKPEHYNLIKTTFLREFDTNIIDQYSQSGDEAKVNAALLSIAQSEDTSFAEKIIKLDFEKFGGSIAFTLGELGECKVSSQYLVEQLKSNDSHSIILYEAIGKIGTEEDLTASTKIYKEKNNDGYSFAVYNFRVRGVVDSTENDINVLLKNLEQLDDKEKLFRSLFALYRVGSDKIDAKILEPILTGEFDASTKLYALGILRRNSNFPFPFALVKQLISNDNWSVRCEAARTVCYFPFRTMQQINLFLNLLSDENPNVAITAAQSLVNLNIEDEELESRLLDKLDKIYKNDLNDNVKGEILLALQNYYPEDTVELLKAHGNDVKIIYNFQLLGNYNYDPHYAYKKLEVNLPFATDYQKFFIHSNIANFYDSLKTEDEYANLILEQYKSGTPLTIVLYNYVIDSSFVVTHSAVLRNSIEKLVAEHISDSEYNQALSSLFNFTDYIDSNFTKVLLQKISESTNFDLQYDLKNQIKLSNEAKVYREKLFDKLFINMFEYSKAIIETDKGNFTIQFTPEVAPISVGNFVFLAENDFYDNVIFHRVVPNFVIQTGDPSGTGWSGPSHTIVSEFSTQPFDTYYVGMASAGKDTEGSQWFVMQNHYPHLDGNYTNFGKVIDGFEVIDSIDQYDIVKNVKLIK